jgi:hypothetical protein
MDVLFPTLLMAPARLAFVVTVAAFPEIEAVIVLVKVLFPATD